MSKLVAFAAIQGGYKVVSTAEGEFNKALATFNADSKIEFPNTGYYLPVIYSLTGMKVETLEDLKKPLEFARGLLPPHARQVVAPMSLWRVHFSQAQYGPYVIWCRNGAPLQKWAERTECTPLMQCTRYRWG